MVSVPAVIEPLILPATRALSATTMPATSLPSPWISAAQLMSPSILPSRCRSAVAVMSPLIMISGPSTEKVAPAIVLLVDGRTIDSGFFENIGRYLQQGTRVDRSAVESDLKMQVRAGGTAGASDHPDQPAGADHVADAGAKREHVGIARA